MRARSPAAPAAKTNLLSKLFIVKQSVQGKDRSPGTAQPGLASGPVRRGATTILLCGLLLTGGAAQGGEEAALRLSPALGPRPPDADESERALLRVEWKAARTRGEESQTLLDTLDRVKRLEATAAEVRAALERVPAPAPAPPSGPAPIPPQIRASGETGAVANNGQAAGSDGPPWTLIGAVAGAVLAAAAWILRRRRTPDNAVEPESTSMAMTVMADVPPVPTRRKRRRIA